MRNNVGMKALAIAIAIVIVASSVAMYSATDVEKGIDGSGGKGVISLMPPPFIGVAGASLVDVAAQRAGTTFLKEEAGISAYTNVGEAIDIEKVKATFRTIEYETNEYIIGSVPLPDYEETEDVHVYVHKDGWVVTYYLKEEVVAKILDWNDYTTDEKITGTKLEDGVSVVCNAACVPIRDLKYYDFRYPNAEKLMIIADALWSDGTDTFNVKLPSDFVFYERSYSHYLNPSPYYDGNSDMYIDEGKISDMAGYRTNYGLLSPTQLSVDDFHTVKIIGAHHVDKTFDAIVLVYREA
ncbi:hypothetical protein C5S31_10105 [ANME-1 cluster archaeon GoMg2]|nr:hypothetical protein [ANME-1 cluster archaeon GoMg2]